MGWSSGPSCANRANSPIIPLCFTVCFHFPEFTTLLRLIISTSVYMPFWLTSALRIPPSRLIAKRSCLVKVSSTTMASKSRPRVNRVTTVDEARRLGLPTAKEVGWLKAVNPGNSRWPTDEEEDKKIEGAWLASDSGAGVAVEQAERRGHETFPSAYSRLAV